MPVAVRQVSVSSEPETSYFLRVDWKGRDLASGFQVLLTDGQSAWDGEVSGEAVCNEAAELEMKKQRYVQDLHQVLTGEGVSNTGHSFALTPCHSPGTSRTLTYERVQRDIWIKLGSVLLSEHPAPLEEVRALLAHFLAQTTTLEDRNQKLQEENHRLGQEQQHITAELKRYAVVKEALEADLYSRFVLVLNEKKAKIRSLQERITDLQEDSHAGGENSSPCPRGEAAGAKPASGEEDEYGGSTDEERDGEQAAGSAPTTSAAPIQANDTQRHSALDDSLSDSTDVAPSRKRRFRHLKPPELVAKRPTPEATRTERRDSLVKSNTTANQQQAPRRSSDAMATSPDAEDLFEDF